MDSWVDIPEQRIIINKVIQLMVSDFPKRFFLIKGPSGSGKTQTSIEIGKYWAEINDSAHYIYLDGDSSRSEKAYYPFVSSLSVFKKKHLQENVKKVTSNKKE